MRTVVSACLALVCPLIIAQKRGDQAAVSQDRFAGSVRRIISAGYRGDVDALKTGLDRLGKAKAVSPHLLSYWRGYAYWRLGQADSRSSGTAVEGFVNRAVAELEKCVQQQQNFADGFALLAALYDWQMSYHHDNKALYAQRAGAALDRALSLAPKNPRVILSKAWDLLHTPTQYGGSVQGALEKLEEARKAIRGSDGRSLPWPNWGIVDVHLAFGDAYLALKKPDAARRAYHSALSLEPKCADARDRGIPASQRLAHVMEGSILPKQPLPAPPRDDVGAMRGWPRWRGPSRNGVSREGTWATKGKELWRRNVGLGYSGLVVSDGILLTKGYDSRAGRDIITALDAESGKERWHHTVPCAIWNEMHAGGALSTPTVERRRVYILNREGRIHCLGLRDGATIWKRSLVDEVGLQVSRWGFAASPVVLGKQVIVNVGRIVSIDKATGKTQWKTRHFGDAYSTPTPFWYQDEPYLAVFNATGLVVLKVQTGQEQALYPWKTTYDQNCASPIVLENGRIFISSGMGRGCALLAFDGTKLKQLWAGTAMKNTMTGCVEHGGALIGFNNRILTCIDQDGRTRWSQRGFGRGSLSLAADRLLILSENGRLVVADASASTFSPLHELAVFKEGNCWTAPVLVDGLLFLRNSLGTLVCRDHRP